MGTKDQCADSLAKFLRGGPDQKKAREHLSLINLEDCINGRDAHVMTCGLRNSFHLCRVFCSSSDLLAPELSGSDLLDLFPSCAGKCLCDDKRLRDERRSVAISVLSKGTVCFL